MQLLTTHARQLRFVVWSGLAAALLVPLLSGCAYYDKLRGSGFQREPVSASIRSDTEDAKPSGFFTDKRSDEIEKRLGGFD